MTKRELKRYKTMDAELKRLGKKREELENEIQSPKIPTISDMPKGGEGLDTADKIIKLIELKTIYEKQWDELIQERMRIEKAINSLGDSTERALMGYKYIDGLTWEEVCVKISYSWKQTHRIHGRALKNIA